MSEDVTAGLLACAKAPELPAELSGLVRQLVGVLHDKLARNERQMSYYHDRQPVRNLGIAVPDSFKGKVDTSVGWAAKAVDMLASRSRFDGFTMAGGDSTELDVLMRDNRMAETYAMAVPAELVHSCGFWTVSPGDTDEGEPAAVVNYHDAVSASALWDYRRKRILAGLVVEDMRPKRSGRPGEYEPCLVVIHTTESVTQIARGDGDEWHAETLPNLVGRPLMEPMAYKPSVNRPFGKSRVSRTVMGIVDDMQREILRTSIHSEMFSSVQKAVLGVTDEQFDALTANKYNAAITSLFVATKDKDGDVPQLTQFQQASMEPHVAMMNKLASRMASETCLPVSAFGVDSSVYQSAESLRASTADLVVEAESLNRTNGQALRNVAMLALCVARNRRMADLTEEERSVTVHWKDPSMPSLAAQSDAMVKQAGVVDWLPETSVFWEQLGYDEEQRMRIQSEKRRARGQANVNAIAAALMAGGKQHEPAEGQGAEEVGD